MSTFVEQLGWVLVHSLWQFALLATLAFVLQRVLRSVSSAARYAVLLTLLGGVVMAPLVTWMLLPDLAPAPVVVVESQVAVPQPAPVPVVIAQVPDAPSPSEVQQVTPTASSDPVVPRIAAAPVVLPESPKSSWSEWVQEAVTPWLSTIVWGWSLGVLAFALRPLLSWFTVHRLRTTGVSPVPEGVQAALTATAQRLGITHTVRVLQSAVVQVPIVTGYFKPVILLPISIVTGMPASQLEAILAHELAHIRRHDYLVNLLQTLIETIFFYHPAVWWLSHQIRCERENCCDDIAVTALGSRLDYSRALLALEELRSVQSPLALGANGGSLLSRVRRLFHREPAPDTLSNGSMALGATLVVGILALAAIAAAGPNADKVDSSGALPDPDGERAAWKEIERLKTNVYGGAADWFHNTHHYESFVSGINPGLDPSQLAQMRKDLKIEHLPHDADLWSVPKEAWPHIGRLGSLTELSIVGSDMRGQTQHLSHLKNLRSLRVSTSKFLPADLAELRSLTNLEELDVTLTVFEESKAVLEAQIGELSDREKVAYRELISDPTRDHLLRAAVLTDRALDQLQNLKQLRILRLVNTFASGITVERLSRYAKLERLELGLVAYQPESLQVLSQLPELRELSWIPFSKQEVLPIVCQLTHLEKIERGAEDLTDEGVAELLKLQTLKSLVLWNAQITDVGLLKLAELPQLETLDVRSVPGITAAGVQRFQVQRPTCRVIHTEKDLKQTAKKESSKPVVAKLPGGLEVELVGVTKNFAPSKEGWKPDGSPIGEVPEWKATRVLSREGNSTTFGSEGTPHPDARDWLIEMRGFKSTPSYEVNLFDPSSWNKSEFPEPHRTRLSMLRSNPTEVKNFQIRITDDPWGPYQQVGPDGSLLNELNLTALEKKHYDKIRVEHCGPNPHNPEEGELSLRFQGATFFEEKDWGYDFEVHAIGLDGEPLKAFPWNSSGLLNTTTLQYLTSDHLSAIKIARWEYRLRPYRHVITFENVSFEPGKKTEPKVTVESIAVLEPKPAVAKLPDGLELELLGVTPYRGAGQDGWTPDGKRFEAAPDWAAAIQVELVPPGGNSDGVDDDFRDFIVRVRGATQNQLAMYSYSGMPVRLGEGTWVGRMTVLTYNQQVQRLRIGLPGEWGPYRVLSVDPKVPPKAKAVEVPAELPAPYRKIYDSIQPAIEEGKDLTFWLLPRLQPDGEAIPESELKQGSYTRVVWKGQPANPDLKYTTSEAVLVDIAGKRHTTTGTTNVQDGKSQWDVDLFRVPLAQVSHVEYRLRPYQYVVTFNNVALHVGAECGPNVVVESPLDEAENAKAPPPLEFRLVAPATVKEPVEFAGQKWFSVAGKAAGDSAGKPVVGQSALGLPVERLSESQEHQGLVGDTSATALTWDGTWHVEKCEVQLDPNGGERFTISVTLDAQGGKALRTLTTSALRQRLAILVEQRILVAPTIQDSIGTAFVITGNFTKEQADSLAKAIRRGMAPAVGQSYPTGQRSTESWGPAKNGVRSRLTLLDSKPHVGSVKVRVELFNVGDVAQEFACDPRKAGKAFVIQTRDGKQVWHAMENLPVKDLHNSNTSITIPPGKSVTLLDEFDLGYAVFFEKAAEYRLRFGGDCEFPGVVSEDYPESNTLTIELPDGPRPLIQRIGLLLKHDHNISKVNSFHWGGAWAVDDHTFVFRRLDYVYVNQVTLQFTDSVEPAPLYVPKYPQDVPTPKARDVLLGKTQLGYAHLQIPELADQEWPKCEEQIRERLGKELAQVEAVPVAPRSRTVTLSLQDKPLREALAAVAEQMGLTLEIDEAALAGTEFDLKRLVTAELHDEPLADSMALICDFPSAISSGASWRLRGETLVLTTIEAEMQRRVAATPEWLRPFLVKGVFPQIDDAGEVTALYFSQDALTDELLPRLPELSQLKSIQFDPRCPATDAGLAQLRKIKALDTIELTGGRADVYRMDEILGVLKTIPALKTLSLTETGVTDAGVAQIGEMIALERLTIHQEGRITDRAVDTVAKMTQLKSLTLTQYVATEYFGKMAFSAESLRGLSQLKSLEHLQLTGIPVPGEVIDFPQLRSLGITGDEIDDRVAARIAQCHQLTSLTLSGTRITDEGLRQIAGGTRLDYFSLTNTPITDRGISYLVTLPLRHLELRGVNLTSAAFEHLAKIPTLQRIDVTRAGSGMTIDGMQALKDAPRLRTLWIIGFPHDANYFALGELKQLRELHFEMSLTRLHELEFLEEALPHTRVSAGTGGGWVGGGIRRKGR